MFELINVSKSYGNKNSRLEVLKRVNLSLPNSGLVAILGKSGSGKSTLLNLLMGIDKPTSGRILFNGINLNRLRNKKEYLNTSIGVLFQHFNLFSDLSSLDNVILPSLIKGENKKLAVEKAKALFNKYHLSYLIEQKFDTLSGGEKQRVALLRALINDPKVIICDEPTGALDSNNSILIMDELKALSKSKLVIVVTHNETLIKEYEDYRINIVNHHVSELNIKPALTRCRYRNSSTNNNVVTSFLKLHLKKHLVRNVLSTVAITFSSLCLLLSLGYINGSRASSETYQRQSLQYTSATIAKKTSVEVKDSPIVISKLTRPEISEVSFLFDAMDSIKLLNNYQAIFPVMPSFYFDTKSYDNIEYIPIYNFSNYKDLFIAGTLPNLEFNEAVVNEEFVNRFNYSNQEIINRVIKLSYVSEVVNTTKSGKVAKDKIEFNENLKIVGVVKEFAYLNTPKIYYSYLGLDDLLSNIVLTNYSSEYKSNISAKDSVTIAGNNSPSSSYSYQLYVDDINEVKELYKLKEKYDQIGGFDIESNCYSISSNYSSMTEIVSSSLIVFIAIALVGAVFMVIVSAYSNFIQSKKESAILSILGMKRLLIFNIFNLENLIVSIVGLVISFSLVLPFQTLVNLVIEQCFNLSNLVVVPFISFSSLLIVLCTISISFLATIIPFTFYKHGYVLEELKDE